MRNENQVRHPGLLGARAVVQFFGFVHGGKHRDAPAGRVNDLALWPEEAGAQFIAQRLVFVRRNNAAGLTSFQVKVQEAGHARVHDARAGL